MSSNPDRRDISKHDEAGNGASGKAVLFDFRRPDRVPKSQIRAVQALYDGFLRTFGSSLSSYLRTYVKTRLVSIEQQTYSEFLAALPTPTCLVSLGLQPKRVTAILDLAPPLVFSMLEVLLGAKTSGEVNTQREITEIEQNILNDILRMIARELHEAWKTVGDLGLELQGVEKDPQATQSLDAAEPVVVFTAEVKFGDVAAAMKFAMPSITLKMLGQEVERQRLLQRTEVGGVDRRRMSHLLKKATLRAEARLGGASIMVRDILELQEGQVLTFGHPVDRELDCALNGKTLYKGRIVSAGSKMVFRVDTVLKSGDAGESGRT